MSGFNHIPPPAQGKGTPKVNYERHSYEHSGSGHMINVVRAKD